MKEEKNTETLIEQIMKAYSEALKRNIEANTVIIDSELAYSQGLTQVLDDGFTERRIIEQPMIFGLRIKYAPPHSLPNDAAFAMAKLPHVDPSYEDLLRENEELKAKYNKLVEDMQEFVDNLKN